MASAGIPRALVAWLQNFRSGNQPRRNLFLSGHECSLFSADLLADLLAWPKIIWRINRFSRGLGLGLFAAGHSLSTGMDLGSKPFSADVGGFALCDVPVARDSGKLQGVVRLRLAVGIRRP